MPKTRAEIGQEILTVCAGSETEITLLAQADALATCVGAIMHRSGKSLAHAMAVADELHESILRHIAQNWGRIEGVQ